MKQIIIYITLALFATLQTFAQTNTYEYDANNRLTKVTYGNGVTVAYSYDALGNRTSKKVTVSATKYTVTTSVNPANAGTVTGGGSYYKDSSIELKAVANSGYKFSKWSDGNTDNPRTITVTGNKTYTAQFVEADDIEPVDEDDNVDYGNDLDKNSDLDGNIIGDIYYNINTGNGGYNAAEGCIVVKKPTDDGTVNNLEGKDIFGEDFKSQFTGIVFKVPAGKGRIKVDAETTGNMLLKVKIGSNEPVEMELNGKLKVTFPYNVSKTTYVYIYAGTTNEAKGLGTTNDAEDAALKIYGIEFIRDETTAIGASLNDNGKMTNDSWYTIDGVKLNGEPTKKGIYIRNGNKVVK